MKTSELMIGDLLHLNRRPVRVDAIGFNGSISYSEKGGFGCIGVDKFSPIPLTEEILVKNGFYRSPRWHYCEITIGNFLIHVQLGCGGKIDYVDITSKLSNAIARKEIDMTTHINYVHQLQHLLRLCGIEKEFEL